MEPLQLKQNLTDLYLSDVYRDVWLFKFLIFCEEMFGRGEPISVKEHSELNSKYTEEGIINMLEFLVDNIFVVFKRSACQWVQIVPSPSRYIESNITIMLKLFNFLKIYISHSDGKTSVERDLVEIFKYDAFHVSCVAVNLMVNTFYLIRTREIIRYRLTTTLRRRQIKKYTASN